MSSELEAAVAAADVERVPALLAHLTAAERASLAPQALAWHAHAESEAWFAPDAPRDYRARSRAHEATVLALFASGSLADVRTCKWRLAFPASLADVLIARRPSWLQTWCEAEIENAYAVVRRIERAGLAQPRPGASRTLGVIRLAGRLSEAGRRLLDDDPGAIESDVWDLFVYDGTQEQSLAGNEKYSGAEGGWSGVLVELARDGVLSRDRLLDASLDALERGFNQFRAGWFSRFHERLEPTIAERAERAAHYVRLVSSPVPPTVSFAVSALVALDAAGVALPSDTIAKLASAYHAKAKATALSALRLAARLLRERADKRHFAPSIASALEHPAAEVQRAALDVLERDVDAADDAVQRVLEDLETSIVPSLRTRYRALLRAPKRAAAPLAAPASPVPERIRIEPVATLDELIDAASAAIEGACPPYEFDRVLDGVARLCGDRPDGFDRLTGPLKKRAAHVLRTRPHAYLQASLAAVVAAWIGRERVAVPVPAGAPLIGFLASRASEVATRAATGRPIGLCALPTYRDCTIEPREFVRRLVGANVLRYDLIAALLRLGRDGQKEALEAAGGLSKALGALVRYALGGPAPAAFGDDVALWVAASRARDPFSDDPALEARYPELGTGATRVAELRLAWHEERHKGNARRDGTVPTVTYNRPALVVVPAPAQPSAVDRPSVNFYAELAHGKRPWEDTPIEQVRWIDAIWAGNQEASSALGCFEFSRNLDWHVARWSDRAYLEPLAEPGPPLGPASLMLLALALLAKEAAQGVLGVEAIANGIASGRIDAVRLTAICTYVVDWIPYTVTKRAVTRLEQIGRRSPHHARSLAGALEAALRGEAPAKTGARRALRNVLDELLVDVNASLVSVAESFVTIT